MRELTAAEAAATIRSGQTITVSGLAGNLVPERILQEIEARFVETGSPSELTEIHPWLYGGPDGTGLNRWAHPGLLKRILGSTYILPSMSKTAEINRLVLDDAVEGYCWPANAIFQMLRAVGAGRVGHVTEVGLDTFADPRRDGGRLNASAKEDLIDLVDIAGREHLLYRSIPIDVALIRASTADTEGNLFCDDEGLTQGICLQATAAHNSGGMVIAQVRRIVETGTMHPLMAEVPGILVDAVVVEESGRQWEYGGGDVPATTGARRMTPPPVVNASWGAAAVIGRRALMEIRAGHTVNVGGGVPISHMVPLAAAEGADGRFRWSVEHGVFGGRVQSATHWNPTAITSPGWLLDFYNGGGLDQSFLAMGQVDRWGNVNVGKLGRQLPGPGGFTDIAECTRKVTFVGTLTTGGLQIGPPGDTLTIEREGTERKFVEDVEMVCFSGRRALERGQEITYVTERAVFRLTPGGLVLSEIAPGIDVRSQVLDHCAFPVTVAPDLQPMDPRVFAPGLMGWVPAPVD